MQIIDLLFHFDKYLQTFVQQYAAMSYGFLFLIIFVETGIVVMPFLPGDSLLFAAGALAAIGSMNLGILLVIVFLAAVIGDALNYHVGKFVGPKIFKKESSFFFHKEHLVRAQKFYEKHGRKTIILARFMPIIRTFAPFVAGIGMMPYKSFLGYNILGAALWCVVFILGGFLFGNIPWVKEHFGLIILAIIGISFIPFVKEILFHFFRKNEKGAPG